MKTLKITQNIYKSNFLFSFEFFLSSQNRLFSKKSIFPNIIKYNKIYNKIKYFIIS